MLRCYIMLDLFILFISMPVGVAGLIGHNAVEQVNVPRGVRFSLTCLCIRALESRLHRFFFCRHSIAKRTMEMLH